MPRRNFNPKIILDRRDHCGDRCEGTLENGERCNVPIARGRFHADHNTPDQMGGEPTFENCRILCLPCHAAKTALDQGNIARAKRVEAKHRGNVVETPAKIQGQPLPTSRRAAERKARGSRPPVERKRGLYADVPETSQLQAPRGTR